MKQEDINKIEELIQEVKNVDDKEFKRRGRVIRAIYWLETEINRIKSKSNDQEVTEEVTEE